MKCFNLLANPFVIRCNWRKILAFNIVVMDSHPRLHYRPGYDVCRWSLCILVLNGIRLCRLLDDFGVG